MAENDITRLGIDATNIIPVLGSIDEAFLKLVKSLAETGRVVGVTNVVMDEQSGKLKQLGVQLTETQKVLYTFGEVEKDGKSSVELLTTALKNQVTVLDADRIMVERLSRAKTEAIALQRQQAEQTRAESNNDRLMVQRIARAKTEEVERVKEASREMAAAQATLNAQRGQYAASMVSRGYSVPEMRARGATQVEMFNVQQEAGKLNELVAKHSITTGQIDRMWKQLKIGPAQYTGALQTVQAQMQRLMVSHQMVGNTSREAFSSLMISQINQQAAAAKALDTNTKAATDSSRGLLISWQSFARLLTIQLLHQAISKISSALRQGTQDAMEFQIRISEIRTISQQNQLATTEWAAGLRKVSESFGIDTLDAAEATYQTLSNQITQGGSALNFVADASKLAITSVSTLTQSVNTLSSVINSYGKEAGTTEQISAKLFTAVNLGRFRLNDMADSLGNVTVLAREAGVSFDEVLSGMIAMTIQGFTWSQAATQMRGLMNQFIKPSQDMKKFFKEIGVESGEAAIKTYGFIGVLELLRQKTGDSSTELAKEVRNMRGLLGALALTGTGHEKFIEAQQKLKVSTEEYNKAFEISMESSARAIKIETQKVKQYFMQDIGTDALRAIVSTSNAIGGFHNAVKVAMESVVALAGIMLTVGVANFILYRRELAATQAQLVATSSAARGFGMIMKGIGVASIGVVVFEIVKQAIDAWEERLIEAHNKSVELSRQRIEQARNESKAVADALTQSFSTFSQQVGITAATKISEINRFTEAILANVRDISKLMDESAQTVSSILSKELSLISKTISDAEGQVKAGESFILGLDKRTDQMTEKFIKDSLTGDPDKQIDYLNKARGKLVDELSTTKDLDNLKAVTDQILDNINESQTIVINTGKQNNAHAEQRLHIESQIKKEEINYGERMRKVEIDLDKLRGKSRTQAVKDAITELRVKQNTLRVEYTAKMADYKRELDERKKVAFDANNFNYTQNVELTKKLAIQQEEIINRNNKISIEGEQKRKIEVEATIKEIKDLGRELDRVPFDKVMQQRPEEMQEFFRKREAAMTALISIMISQESKLTDAGVNNIQELIDNLQQEHMTVTLAIEGKEPLDEIIKKLESERDKFKKITDDITAALARPDKVSEQRFKIVDILNKLAAVKGGAEQIAKGAAGEAFTKLPYDMLLKLSPETYTSIARAVSAGSFESFEKLPFELFRAIRDEAGIGKKQYTNLKETIDNRRDLLAKQEAAQKKLDAVMVELGIKEPIDAMKQAVKTIPEVLKGFEEAIKKSTDNIAELARQISLIQIPQAPASETPQKPPQFDKGKAFGGFITASSGKMMAGIDSVPALLSPGEFVMNAASTRKFYSQLVAMNSVGRFADGGAISNSVSVGDVNVSLKSSGNESVDVLKIGRLLQREIRRGTLSLS